MKLIKVMVSCLLGTFSSLSASAFPNAEPLSRAHAHNDYLHERPLSDALEQGFSSVEADVFLIGGRFLVAHELEEVRPERTLESLYLEPLRERVLRNGGSVHPEGREFLLWIDVKSDGREAWPALRNVLLQYQSILSVVRDGRWEPGPVTVILSGNRAASLMLSDVLVPAVLDGRLPDLTLGLDPVIMPWLSDDYTRYFDWDGTGVMPANAAERLEEAVSAAHRRGFRIRLWATPDTEEAWGVLEAAGVDLINTDDLEGLSRFLRRPVKIE